MNEQLTILGTVVPESQDVRAYLVQQTTNAILEQGKEVQAAVLIKFLGDMLNDVKTGLTEAIEKDKLTGNNRYNGYTVTVGTKENYSWKGVNTPKLAEAQTNEAIAKANLDEAKKVTKAVQEAIIAAVKTGGYTELDGEKVIEITKVDKDETKYISIIAPKTSKK